MTPNGSVSVVHLAQTPPKQRFQATSGISAVRCEQMQLQDCWGRVLGAVGFLPIFGGSASATTPSTGAPPRPSQRPSDEPPSQVRIHIQDWIELEEIK